jgi:Na+/melibiose symporter-like transporter
MDRNDLDKIQQQAKLWNLYAIGSPIYLILFVLVLHLFDSLHYDFLFWASIIVFGASSIIWWAWAVVTIYKLTETLKAADENFGMILKEIREFKQSLNDHRWERRE